MHPIQQEGGIFSSGVKHPARDAGHRRLAPNLRMRGATSPLPTRLYGVHRRNCTMLIFTALDLQFVLHGRALLYVTNVGTFHWIHDVMFTGVNQLMCWLEVNFTSILCDPPCNKPTLRHHLVMTARCFGLTGISHRLSPAIRTKDC